MLVFPSSPNAGDVFSPGPGFPSWTWDGEKWTRGAAASLALESLSDVSFEYLEQGQVITWDAAQEKWVNGAPPAYELEALMDVALAVPVANGQVLAWNAATSRWRNTSIPTPTLAGLSDVGLSSPTWGQVLTYNGGTQRWENGSTVSGPFTVNAASSGISLRVDGAANTTASEIYGNPNGLFIQAGNNMAGPASDYWCLNVTTPELGGLLRIQVDGSGILGRLNWNTAGNFTVSAPTSGGSHTLTVYGNQGEFAMLAVGAGGALATAGDISMYTSDWNALALRISGDTGLVQMQPKPNTQWGPQGLSVVLAAGQTLTNRTYIAEFISNSWTSNSGVLIMAGTNPGAGYQWNTATDGGNVLTCSAISTWDGQRRDLFVVDQGGYIQLPNVATTSGPVNCRLEPSWGTFISMTTSVRRNKRDICTVEREHAREIVKALRPITYRSKCEKDNQQATYYGLIAEEVAEVAPNLVDYDDDGLPRSVHYDRIAMLMLPLLQEWLEDRC